jgi:hypothetical protein
MKICAGFWRILILFSPGRLSQANAGLYNIKIDPRIPLAFLPHPG